MTEGNDPLGILTPTKKSPDSDPLGILSDPPKKKVVTEPDSSSGSKTTQPTSGSGSSLSQTGTVTETEKSAIADYLKSDQASQNVNVDIENAVLPSPVVAENNILPLPKPKPEQTIEDVDSVYSAAIQRGLNQGALADILNVNGGVIDDAAIAEIARLQAESRNLKQSEAYQKFSNAKTIGESLSSLTESPEAFATIVAELSLESLSAMARHGLTRIGAAAGTGAAMGSVIPGAGTAAGAAMGTLTGLGLTSLNLEYSGKMMEVFGEMGIDVTDAEALKKVFSDEAKLAEARELGWKRGIPVALFDMVSGGVAGKIISKPAKSIIGKVAGNAAEMGVQATLGGAGEAAGQLSAGEDFNPSSIIAEMIGETGTAPVEIFAGVSFRKANKGEPTATDISKAVGSIPPGVDKVKAIAEQIDVAVSSGEISQEQAQVLINEAAVAVENDTKIPIQIQGEQRANTLPLLVQKSGLEEGIATLQEQKTVTDPAFHGVIDNQIADVKSRVEVLDAEIKAIVDPKAQEEVASTSITALPKDEFVASIADGTAEAVLESGQVSQLDFMEKVEEYGLPLPKFFLNQQGDNTVNEQAGPVDEDGEARLLELITNAQERSGINNLNEVSETQTIQNEKETTQAEGLLTEQGGSLQTTPKSTPTPVSEEKVGEKVYIDKSGTFTVTKDDFGTLTVTDKRNKEVTPQKRGRIIKEYLDNYDFNTGEEVDLSGMSSASPDEVSERIASESKNPKQILEQLSITQERLSEDELDFKERMIAENMGKVSPESFAKFGDRNMLESEGKSKLDFGGKVKLNYIRSGGASIDMIAQAAEYAAYGDSDGTQISPQDVVDFILKYPEGPRTFYNQKNPAYKSLVDAFYNITGFNPNQAMIDKVMAENVTDENFAGQEPDFQEVGKAEEPEQRKRAFTQQVLKSTDVKGQSKAKIRNDQIYYFRQKNILSLAEANARINEIGIPDAIALFSDFNNGINGGVRSVLGQVLIKKLEDSGDVDGAIDLLDEVTKRATDSGQFIQAFALWSRLTPAGQLRAAEKMVEKQAKVRAEKDKKKIDKAKKAVQLAIEESADEAIEKVTGQITSVANSDTPKKRSADFGAKNKIFTKEKYLAARAKVRKSGLFSTPFSEEAINIAGYVIEGGARKFADFSADAISEFGAKARPYLRSLYDVVTKRLIDEGDYKASDFSTPEQITEFENADRNARIEKQFEKAIKEKSEKEFTKALKMLNESENRDAIWNKYRDFAISRLKNIPASLLFSEAKGKPVLQEFIDGLVANLRGKLKEAAPQQEAVKADARPAIQIIGDAIKNFEKYAEVWEVVSKDLRKKYADKPDKLKILDDTFGAIMDTPFSASLINKAIKAELKSLDKTIAEIAKAHYTVYDRTKMSLVDKLVFEAGVSPAEGKRLADAIEKEFDRIFTEKRKQALDRLVKEGVVREKAKDVLKNELTTLLNLGGFDDDAFLKAWAEANGYPKLTPENVEEIKRLADLVAKAPEGFQKFRAMEDLLAYQSKIEGISLWDVGISVWYANVLSGYQTQLVNIVSTGYNTFFNYLNAVAQNPSSAAFIAKGWWAGIQHGVVEAKDVLRSGYNPIRGKLEVPATLEVYKWRGGNLNPMNYLKYVRRSMVAADVLFFEGLKEMRAYQLAQKMAKESQKDNPDIDLRNAALAILNKTDSDVVAIQNDAELEFLDKVEAIENGNLSREQKDKEIKQAKNDMGRRVFELMHEHRPQELVEQVAAYAAKGTYNYAPEGVLGELARGANFMLSKIPVMRLVIPFTNIIANVANESMNYTPYGFVKRATGGSILNIGSKLNKTVAPKVVLTEQEKTDLMVKAIIGTSLMTTAFILSGIAGDDEEPLIEITANGYGAMQYKKNYVLRDAGWRPYSFRVKNPVTGKYGRWISYQFITPLNIGLSFIGNIRDAEKYKKEKLSEEGALAKYSIAASLTYRAILDMTFISSLNSFLSAAMNPQDDDTMDNFTKGAIATARAVVIPNLWNQTFKLMQEINEIPNKQVKDSYMGEFLKNIPVARDGWEDMVNGLGEKVVPNTDKFISSGEKSPIWQLIVDKDMTNLAVPSKKTVTIPDPNKLTDYGKKGKDYVFRGKDSNAYIPKSSKKIAAVETVLTDKEYYDFCIIRGSIIKTAIQQKISSNKTGDLNKEWMTEIQKDATKQAKWEIFQKRQN